MLFERVEFGKGELTLFELRYYLWKWSCDPAARALPGAHSIFNAMQCLQSRSELLALSGESSALCMKTFHSWCQARPFQVMMRSRKYVKDYMCHTRKITDSLDHWISLGMVV